MKKIILLICASMLIFSCSKSSDDANATAQQAGNLISRLETTTNGSTQKNYYTYNGNKILKIVSNGMREIRFTYDGNFISKQETFENNFLTTTITYSYENGKLKSVYQTNTEPNEANNYKQVFVHNVDGSINFTNFSYQSPNTEIVDCTGKYTFVNSNRTKVEFNNVTTSSVSIYTYDSKNNGFRNILGFDKLIFIEGSMPNNFQTINFQSTNIANNTISFTSEAVNTYIYNANNYPISEVRFSTGSITTSPPTVTTRTTNYFY